MAVLGTFSSFTTARLGIYASQASLNVTGNNIANINTTGYTRQRMDLVSLYSKGAGKYANIFNRNVGYGHHRQVVEIVAENHYLISSHLMSQRLYR